MNIGKVSRCGRDLEGGRYGEGRSFFFKQKTAYGNLSGLVGSEMGIRDWYTNLRNPASDSGAYALVLEEVYDVLSGVVDSNSNGHTPTEHGL